MKNQITLSLITVAILGLNGCGETNSKTEVSKDKIELSSIQKLSNASTKHSKSDWIAIEDRVQSLDNTEGFNNMLLGSIEKNVANLTYVGIDKEMAYATNSDAIFNDLTDLDIGDLDNQVVAECKDDESCKEMAYDSLEPIFTIDKEMAYVMATDIRIDEKKPTTMDGLLKEFTCDAGLVRKVQFYGVEDNFSASNGNETAYPSIQVVNNAGIQAYGGTGLSNYDFSTQNTLFAEEVKNLPSSIANGHFYIGMKNNGNNDGITLGNLDENVSTEDVFTGTIANNNAGLLKDGSVYHAKLSDISLVDGNTLKNYAYNHGGFDVYVQDDTFVDFIAVATCSKPDYIKEITGIVNNFECSEKETLVKILGGKIDAFALPEDATTPSTTLAGTNTLPKMKYDNPAHDRHFIDTLNLGLTSTQTVTNAEFHIGYKSTNRSLWTNDALYIGEYGVNHGAYKLYDNSSSNFIETTWGTQTVGGETIASTNLELNNTIGTGTVLNTMKSNGFLDIYLQDDTTVDFTQLNLCVKDNCDENAKDIKVDLSQLSAWTTSATDAVNNSNPIPNVWDSSLNWIEFTSKEANGDRVLEIPFCACSNALVDIKSLKADNLATVELDNNTTIVTQNASGQASMKADSNGGVHASGTYTATNTTGPTNHVLRVNVHNQSLWFGVGIEGTLNFKGNLGKCTK